MKAINSLIILFLYFSYSLEAQCIKGNCLDGIGKYIYQDKSSYEGQFLRGDRNGKGSYINKEGHYIGTFKHNMKDGEGKLSYSSGDSYIGQFKLNIIHGKGKYTYSNGDVYKGNWQDGKKEGHGTLIFKNLDTYIGYFVNDKRSGRGTLTTANETKQSGMWQNGYLVHNETPTVHQEMNNTDSNVSLVDCNEINCHEVNGTYTYSDGSIYEGMFINNQPHGEGICFYADGNQYEGGWKNHSPHGIGVMMFSNGTKYGAKWNYGIPLKQITDGDQIELKYKSENIKKEFNEKVEIYSCIIGIASYIHMPSLKYTDDDAYQLYAFLKSPEGGALEDKNISILIDDAATKNNIVNALQEITERADSNDVILVYLSGHGLEGSYIPSDFDGFNNNLPYSQINKIIDTSSAKHKVCVVDACHSGSMFASKDVDYKGLETYYSKFSKLSGGTAFLSSSKSEEVSLEYSGLRHGVFSHFLIEGLKGNADNNLNNIITIHELFKYIHTNVRSYTNMKQTPTISGDYNREMPLSYVRTRKRSI